MDVPLRKNLNWKERRQHTKKNLSLQRKLTLIQYVMVKKSSIHKHGYVHCTHTLFECCARKTKTKRNKITVDFWFYLHSHTHIHTQNNDGIVCVTAIDTKCCVFFDAFEMNHAVFPSFNTSCQITWKKDWRNSFWRAFFLSSICV